MSKKIQNIRGTKDLYFKDFEKQSLVFNDFRKIFDAYGYSEYATPILESMELYEAKSSAEIVERQSYVFKDRGGRKLVLRPEMTPSLARMIASNQNQLPEILRLYSFADCWRYERPQKGRSRNFTQINVDLLGTDCIESDIEIIKIAIDMLAQANIDMNKIVFRISDRRIFDVWFNELGVEDNKKKAVLRILDGIKKNTKESILKELGNVGLSNSQAKSIFSLVSTDPDELLNSGNGVFWSVRKMLKEIKRYGFKNIVFDPTIIRAFDYYTGIIFEVFEESGDFSRSVFGGGRYDGLVEQVGGRPVSGVGFGVSYLALQIALNEQRRDFNFTPKKLYKVIPFSEREVPTSKNLSVELRKSGKNIMEGMPPYNWDKQLKDAWKQKVTAVIAILPRELEKNKVVVIKKDNEKLLRSTISMSDLGQL